MREQHQVAVDQELTLRVAAGVPLAWAESAHAGVVAEVEVYAVSCPGLVERVVEVVERFLSDW